jgi:hypothetical protein
MRGVASLTGTPRLTPEPRLRKNRRAGGGRHGVRAGAQPLATTCLSLLPLLLAVACGTVPRLDAPPPEAAESIAVLGIPNARFWPDRDRDALVREAMLMAERAAAAPSRSQDQSTDFLAISGGGDNGAFGAGLLVGWTAAGTRPEFRVVTGISAGALIAPFAFLGPSYDPALREVFTAVARDDILILRRLTFAVLFGEALADTGPLYRLIARHADQAMLDAIAAEYARGRLLLIGTVNLDLQRPAVWNIGAIAESRHPRALELFRSVLLASAAIPGAFPPVLIDVEVDGRRHQEMHVDGGAATQVFLYPPPVELRERTRAPLADGARTAWVIRNDRLDPEWSNTRRGLFTISRRALSTLIHFSGLNDVIRIFAATGRDGVAFRLAYIDSGFDVTRSGSFDPAYMRALFEHGQARARSGNPWVSAPPGFPAPYDGPR